MDSEALPKSINNGPRVSFNRDVHVKRYGSQLNHNDSLNHDSLPSRSQSPATFRRELPADLSEEALEREAALVLEQANYFGSLPNRKNNRRPVRRSISDATPKKSKRSSIFNIFNTSSTSTNSPVNSKKSTNDRQAINKKVERSKSDVSSRSSKVARRDKSRGIHLNSNSFHNNLTNSSDSSDNNNSFLTSTPKKKVPLSPITEVNSPPPDVNSRTDYFGGFSDKLTNGKGFASSENLDLIPTSDKMSSKYSKSAETMHSSQMPAERPALTKGVAVNKMVKRLSIENISPPPQIIQAGGFSYTNPQLSPVSPTAYSPTKLKSLSPPLTKSDQPSSDIVYAQVVCNELKNVDGSKTITGKETVHNTVKKNRPSASPPPNIKPSHFLEKQPIDSVDNFVKTASSPEKGSKYQYRNSVKIVPEFNNRDDTEFGTFVTDDEPIIKPNIRNHLPRYPSNPNVNHHHFDSTDFEHHHDMRDTDFNGLDMTLSNRRAILESRIKSRISGLHIHNNDTNKTFVQNHIRRTSSSPPTTAKRFYKYGSNEIIDRYSPERNRRDLVHSPSPAYEGNQSKNYADTKLQKNSYYHSKHNDNKHNEKGDSGIEVDNVTRNNRKNKFSSRFNIGRNWNYEDDVIECELFLMKEKKHTEETYPYHLVRTFVYRERSIDDGSHYDPNLDKVNIIKEWKHNKKITKDFLKSKKKKTGLEKVKELFKSKKSNGVDDSEVRSRYREYSPNLDPPPSIHHQQDIATRRRLSTPTASPVITNRSKSLPPKSKKINGTVSSTTSTLKRDKENGAQKFNWFASLERLSKKKTREPSNASTIDRSSVFTKSKTTATKHVPPVNSGSSKTLRFFGDTDRDEVDSISRATSKKLNESQERFKSTSLQNLNGQRKVKPSKLVSRSRAELQNISESTSDTEFNVHDAPMRRPSPPIVSKNLPPPRPPKATKVISSISTTLPRPPRRKMFNEDDVDREFAHRDVKEAMPYYQKKESFESDSLSNLTSARRLRESLSVSRENLSRERFDSDASQRSVVYLHATTVGAIPSQTLDRRRVSGRNSIKTAIQEEQPMKRTVNRSVSLNAPWKPKFISDGYEINYNNDSQKGKYHQNQLRSKSASREKSTERRRDTPKRI